MTRDVIPITTEAPYAQTIERWDAFWSLEDLGRPLWMIPTPPAFTVAEARLVPMRPLLQDKAVQLQASLNFLRWREMLDVGDDFVPHLRPEQGVTIFASAFGCPVRFFDHTLPWAYPLIRSGDPPQKVYELPTPALTDGQLGTILEFIDYFVAETAGRYPIALADLQGPLDTAYLIWEPTDFMLAMYSNPKEVHHLMRLVTDLIIAFVKEQRARSPQFMPCHFPPVWLPDGRGISISDDCLAVLSPNLYEEFALPYVNELSEEFGGVLIHSCGNFLHQLDNLAKVEGLRGINFGASETPFEAVWQRFAGRTAVLPHLGLNKDFPFDGHVEFIEHVFRTSTHARGLCILVSPPSLAPRTEGAGHAAGLVPQSLDQASFGEFVRTSQETLARHFSGG